MRYILLAILFLSACKEIPKAPVERIWEIDKKRSGCTYYTVIKDEPFTVSDGVDVPEEQCPNYGVMGFDIEADAAEMFQYIRDLQELAKRRCK